MSTRPLHPFIAIASAAVLSLGLVGSAVAQEETSPAPSPASEAALESHLERQADRKAARETAQEERAAARAARKTERAAQRTEHRTERAAEHTERRTRRAAERATRKTERAAAREERHTERAEKMAAWAEVKTACRAELKAVHTDPELDRAERRDAWREAKSNCRELFLAARAEASSKASSGDALIDEPYTEAASDGTGVVRTDLGIAEPGSAPGEELGLWHYLIPAGTELARHTHPGWQLARVTDGELEYTVLEGEGTLLRADGSTEAMGPGTYVLATGDGVIENPALIHLGANRTDEPVTILAATLFEAGEAIATVLGEESTEEGVAEPSPEA